MKKVFALLLAAIMSLSFVACNGSTAFNVAKEAYDKIDAAYEITEKFGEDVYEAWRLGIYDDDEILDNGVETLAAELSLSEREIIAGIELIVAGGEEKTMTLTKVEANRLFEYFEDDLDDLFTFCIMVVVYAYKDNGTIEKAQSALDSAKDLMKTMSEKHSDYEHYPNLKEYYTTTKAFFAFCQEPTGSFEQAKTTINDYRNKARNYVNDLDYIFED